MTLPSANRLANPLRGSSMTRQLAGPTLIVAVFATLTAISWRRWAHLLVDFGRELYVPWQLSQGATLYRDVAYFNGPFSPCLNAALFRAFGVSLTTLAVANLILLALLVVLLFRWFAREFGRTAATLACLMFLCGFAFAQYDLAGNYNFVNPYSHEMTHGMFLSVAMITLMCGNQVHLSRPRLMAAGLCWGLLFLGKVEFYFAASGAAAVALGAPLAAKSTTRRRCLVDATVFLLSGSLPIVVFCLGLATKMDFGDAVANVCGSWRWVFASEVTHQHFYRVSAGLDAPLANLAATLLAFTLVLLAIGGLMFFDRWHVHGSRSVWPPILVLALFVTISLLRVRPAGFVVQGRALLPVTLGLCSVFAWSLWKQRRSVQRFRYLLPKTVWSVFALLLLGKMLLAGRIQHYGFALAMPATLLLVACLVAYIPRRVCRWQRGGTAFRMAVIVVLVVDALTLANLSRVQFAQKSLLIRHRGEQFYTENESVLTSGPIINELLSEMEITMSHDSTLVAFPEGVMLNYLTRRRNPSRFTNFMPVEMAMYGEEVMLADLEKQAPDYVLLIDKEMSEYGVGPFGSGQYGASIRAWIDRRYRVTRVWGDEPFCGAGFGVKALARRDLAE